MPLGNHCKLDPTVLPLGLMLRRPQGRVQWWTCRDCPPSYVYYREKLRLTQRDGQVGAHLLNKPLSNHRRICFQGTFKHWENAENLMGKAGYKTVYFVSSFYTEVHRGKQWNMLAAVSIVKLQVVSSFFFFFSFQHFLPCFL